MAPVTPEEWEHLRPVAEWWLGQEIGSTFEEVYSSNPRTSVVLVSAIMEHLLDDLLRRRIAKGAPNFPDRLSFRNQVEWAQRLGVLSCGLAGEMRQLGKVRTCFVHRYTAALDFDQPEVRNLINGLQMPSSERKRRPEARTSEPFRMMWSSNKGRWLWAVVAVIGELRARLERVRRVPRMGYPGSVFFLPRDEILQPFLSGGVSE